MASLLNLRTWVARDVDQALVAGDIPTTGVFWNRTEVNDWIDEGYRLVFGRLVDVEAPWLEEEGSGTYTASSRSVSVRTLAGGITYDPLKLLGVYDITGAATGYGRQIPFVPYQSFSQRRVQLADISGSQVLTDRVCAWFGHAPMNLAFFPVPAANMTVRVRWVPSLPSAQGADGTASRNIASLNTVIAANPDSTGNIPVSIPTAFHEILSAYATVKCKQKEESDFSAHERRYSELLSQLILSADERQQQSSRMVTVSDGSDYPDAAISLNRY